MSRKAAPTLAFIFWNVFFRTPELPAEMVLNMRRRTTALAGTSPGALLKLRHAFLIADLRSRFRLASRGAEFSQDRALPSVRTEVGFSKSITLLLSKTIVGKRPMPISSFSGIHRLAKRLAC